MRLSTWDNALWAAGFVGDVALVFVLVVRRRVREFPIFFAFLVYEALTTILLFFVFRYAGRRGYFLSYWITAFGNYAFQIAVVYEIACDVLRPTGTWVHDARTAFLGWGAVGLCGSAGLGFLIGPSQFKLVDLWDIRVTVFTSLLTCALFLSMSAAANLLGLQQRSYASGLGGGLFIWAFSSLLSEFAHALFGWDRQFLVFGYLQEYVYLLVLLYWIVLFWRSERMQAALSPEMQEYLLALHARVQYDLKKNGGSPP